MALEVVVDLAAAEDDARDVVAPVADGRVVDDLDEGAVRQILDVRRGILEAQKRLRRHHDQWAALGCEGLAAQHVEALGGRGGVDDRAVVLCGELEKTLEAGRRMLWTTAFVGVGEQQRETTLVAPLGAAAHDELIDDHLGDVDEIAKLRLPQHERVVARRGVAVLEAEAAGLCQRRVAHLEAGAGRLDVLERRVLRAVDGVVQDGVAMRERAALSVLTRQADSDAFLEQRRIRECLGMAPLDTAVRSQRVAAAFEHLCELLVDRETLGHCQHLVGQSHELRGSNTRFDRRARRRRERRH